MAGFSPTTYALSKKYTDLEVIGLGALRGKPCTIDNIQKIDGLTTVTFKWIALQPDGVTEVTQYSQIQVQDGTPVYEWISGNTYKYGDLCIYASCLYRCIVDNSDIVFTDTHWNEIGSPDGCYDLADDYSKLPQRFTSADRKMYYTINDYIDASGIKYLKGYYLWNGTKWERCMPDVLDRFTEIPIYEPDGVTIKKYELYFDGRRVITEDIVPYKIVSTYADIDVTVDENTMYFVENATVVGTTVTHYSGDYLYDATAKTITFIDEREDSDIDFNSEYTPVPEYSV